MNKNIIRLGLHKSGANGKSSVHRRVRRVANRTLRQHVSTGGGGSAGTECNKIRRGMPGDYICFDSDRMQFDFGAETERGSGAFMKKTTRSFFHPLMSLQTFSLSHILNLDSFPRRRNPFSWRPKKQDDRLSVEFSIRLLHGTCLQAFPLSQRFCRQAGVWKYQWVLGFPL